MDGKLRQLDTRFVSVCIYKCVCVCICVCIVLGFDLVTEITTVITWIDNKEEIVLLSEYVLGR